MADVSGRDGKTEYGAEPVAKRAHDSHVERAVYRISKLNTCRISFWGFLGFSRAYFAIIRKCKAKQVKYLYLQAIVLHLSICSHFARNILIYNTSVFAQSISHWTPHKNSLVCLSMLAFHPDRNADVEASTNPLFPMRYNTLCSIYSKTVCSESPYVVDAFQEDKHKRRGFLASFIGIFD